MDLSWKLFSRWLALLWLWGEYSDSFDLCFLQALGVILATSVN